MRDEGRAPGRELFLHQQHGRQQLANLGGQLGVAQRVFLDARPLARPVAGHERRGHNLERVEIPGAVAHE
jgi:hypothetical protein